MKNLPKITHLDFEIFYNISVNGAVALRKKIAYFMEVCQKKTCMKIAAGLLRSFGVAEWGGCAVWGF